MKTFIGLDEQQSKELVVELNKLLASYQVYYQNLRGFHWNISGPEFFELHMKFEELYNAAQISIDEIAERVLTLGGTPLHSFSAYLSHSRIAEAVDVSTAKETVRTTFNNLSELVSLERMILSAAGKADDEGTVALMSEYITAQEKTLWMLNAYLK